jgi:hypothetical protein
MFGVSVWIDRTWLRRLATAAAALVVDATPVVARADGSALTACSPEAREGLAKVGLWALAQCDSQTASFGTLNQPDPSITALLNETGGWAAEAYTGAANAHETAGTVP